ncbi:hypothetical protein OG749_47040 (plasmid) [Streptomyces nojiriensis]|uniref:hypothetical protein n=1 Tax=Streptomyces nojiriensis TaxID=66374 RepID=UPI002E196950
MSAHEAGHEWIYRVTAFADTPESKYVLSPYEARSLKQRVEKIGYQAQVSRVPATAFVAVSDDELDLLVEAERATGRGTG